MTKRRRNPAIESICACWETQRVLFPLVFCRFLVDFCPIGASVPSLFGCALNCALCIAVLCCLRLRTATTCFLTRQISRPAGLSCPRTTPSTPKKTKRTSFLSKLARLDPILSQSQTDLEAFDPRSDHHTLPLTLLIIHTFLSASPLPQLSLSSSDLKFRFHLQSHRNIASRSRKASTPCLVPLTAPLARCALQLKQGPSDPNFGSICLTLRGIYLLQCAKRTKATL